MRIGTKLVITYLVLIGMIALASVTALPGWVTGAVIRAEHERLQTQANAFAADLSSRAKYRRATLPAGGTLALFETVLSDVTLAVINDKGVVVKSTDLNLERVKLDLQLLRQVQKRRQLLFPTVPKIPEVGQKLVAIAPIQSDELSGYSLILFRDVQYIQNIAWPITVRMFLVVAVIVLMALAAIGWLSRDLVGRIHSTGAAARALAEGDLTQRAPEVGTDELRDLASHFNHMAERTEALVEGLRRSERLRREMLVTVSHELRTPLTSIAGFAEALRDGVVREEAQKLRYYEIIGGEAARLKRMINDVFDVAKLEAGQVEIRLQDMPVTPWLIEVVDGFTPMAEQRGVRLEVAIGGAAEQARIYGDRDRLDQVVGNLLSNALRFSPDGGVITVRTRVEGEDLVLEVEDLGPGIAPDEVPRVFDQFWQGANKGKGHVGAGLGLAIVKSLVEAHGGTVGVQSTPGAGATFWARLKRLCA